MNRLSVWLHCKQTSLHTICKYAGDCNVRLVAKPITHPCSKFADAETTGGHKTTPVCLMTFARCIWESSAWDQPSVKNMRHTQLMAFCLKNVYFAWWSCPLSASIVGGWKCSSSSSNNKLIVFVFWVTRKFCCKGESWICLGANK